MRLERNSGTPDTPVERWINIAASAKERKAEAQLTDKGWYRAFDDPIPLPDGRKLITLRDAATFITKLPKREHDAPEWQAAIEALMLVADLGGPTMFARIGMLRALNRHHKSAAMSREKHKVGRDVAREAHEEI